MNPKLYAKQAIASNERAILDMLTASGPQTWEALCRECREQATAAEVHVHNAILNLIDAGKVVRAWEDDLDVAGAGWFVYEIPEDL